MLQQSTLNCYSTVYSKCFYIIDIDIDTTEDEDKDGTGNLGTIFGAVIACIALLLIGYIIWKKREELLAFKKNLKKEKESNSTETFSFPPQVSIFTNFIIVFLL